MKRSELLSAIAKDAGITKSAAARAIQSFAFHATRTLRRDGKVSIAGFGSFVVVKRRARPGRNPRTGKEIRIPASRQPKFRPGKALKSAVN